MKNKRNVLIAFILICCLCLSIGYAALTDELEVSATVGVNVTDDDPANDTPAEEEFDQDVHFVENSGSFAASNASCNTNSCTYTIGNDQYTDALDKLGITVAGDAFAVDGDKVTVTAKITNESEEFAANLVVDTVTKSNNQFDITATLAESTLAPKGETTLTIVISLVGSPDENITGYEFSFDIDATRAAAA